MTDDPGVDPRKVWNWLRIFLTIAGCIAMIGGVGIVMTACAMALRGQEVPQFLVQWGAIVIGAFASIGGAIKALSDKI